jgi:hypothetical protein
MAALSIAPALLVLLWTTNRGSPSGDAIKALGIDWVFFAGGWSNGLIFRKNQQIPSILLSNFCGNQELLVECGSDMKGVYLLHPMLASNFYNPGFAYWGILARQLTEKLIHDVNDNFEERLWQDGAGSRHGVFARISLSQALRRFWRSRSRVLRPSGLNQAWRTVPANALQCRRTRHPSLAKKG